MVIFKRVLAYLLWTIIAILFGFCYIRVIIGPPPEEATNFLDLIFNLIYQFAFIRLGLIIGGIIALLYIILDIFHLNKRLKDVKNAIAIRFLIIAFITVSVGIIHYILEKVIDVI